MYKRRRISSGNKEQQQKISKHTAFKALVIDSGAYSIKAGYTIDHEPSIIPNCIMKAKSERKRLFIGRQIDECRDCSGLYYLLPCEKGYITRWEVQKPVWDYVFSRDVCPIDDNPTILTQPLFNFKSIQDCTDEIFFEEYEVPSLLRCNPTDLVYLNYVKEIKHTKSDVLIIDSGYSFTHIIPYIRGRKWLHGIRRLNIGGKLLTNHLKDIISYRQYNVMEETYVINQVKEDTCYVCSNIKQELLDASKPFSNNKIVKNYVLPDFNNIRRGYIQETKTENQNNAEENCQILRLNNERFVVPEILFHPSDINMKCMGLPEAIVKSIFSCPIEYRETLTKNIVIVGGNCKFPGFKDRLYAELRSHLPDAWDLKIYLPDSPISYAWKGGLALTQSPDYKSNLVTKQDYEELGTTIIQERFNNYMIDDTKLNNQEVTEKTNKLEMTCKYLERLKSKSIFGKQDNVNNELNSTVDSHSRIQQPQQPQQQLQEQNDDTNGTTNDTSIDKDDTNAIPPVIDDSSDQEPVEEKLNSTNRRGRKPALLIDDHEIPTEEDEATEENVDEEDLTQSVELFPFGFGSYL